MFLIPASLILLNGLLYFPFPVVRRRLLDKFFVEQPPSYHRKREVQQAIKKYKGGWDKEHQVLTKEREEFMKAYRMEKQMEEAYHHDQVVEDWDDEAMSFY